MSHRCGVLNSNRKCFYINAITHLHLPHSPLCYGWSPSAPVISCPSRKRYQDGADKASVVGKNCSESMLGCYKRLHLWALLNQSSEQQKKWLLWEQSHFGHFWRLVKHGSGTKTTLALLQEGGPLLGPKSGLLSNTWKWIDQGDMCADKARDFIGKGHPGGEQEGKGTQENCSATWLSVSGFMVMGLVFGWSLANHSGSGSFLVVRASLSQDGFQRGGFWEVGRTYGLASPFDLSRILQAGGGLLVPCSLPGLSVVKQLIQMVTVVPGQGGWFWSVVPLPASCRMVPF